MLLLILGKKFKFLFPYTLEHLYNSNLALNWNLFLPQNI